MAKFNAKKVELATKIAKIVKKYEDLMQRLGNSLGTTVGHYNNAHKELVKIDKDVIKISGDKSSNNIKPQIIDKPRE